MFRINTRIPIILAAIVCICFMGVYFMNVFGKLSMLYAELKQQQSLKRIQQQYINNIQDNKELIETYNTPRVIAASEATSAIMNLSTQMRKAGLKETYLKLEQYESMREHNGIIGVSSMVIEGTGTYQQVIDYLSVLLNGDTYYFMDKVRLTSESDGVSLRIACALIGFSEDSDTGAPELPQEYLYMDPFGGGYNVE